MKMDIPADGKAGYVYAVHEREFIRLNENVFKVGRTKHLARRMKDYPKGSLMICATYVSDDSKAEAMLLDGLRGHAKLRPDIGREYFEVSKVVLLTQVMFVACAFQIENTEPPRQQDVHEEQEDDASLLNGQTVNPASSSTSEVSNNWYVIKLMLPNDMIASFPAMYSRLYKMLTQRVIWLQYFASFHRRPDTGIDVCIVADATERSRAAMERSVRSSMGDFATDDHLEVVTTRMPNKMINEHVLNGRNEDIVWTTHWGLTGVFKGGPCCAPGQSRLLPLPEAVQQHSAHLTT